MAASAKSTARVLLDTGFLVALYDANDISHVNPVGSSML